MASNWLIVYIHWTIFKWEISWPSTASTKVPCTTIDPRERKLSKKEYKWHAAKVREDVLLYNWLARVPFFNILEWVSSTNRAFAASDVASISFSFCNSPCSVPAKSKSQNYEVSRCGWKWHDFKCRYGSEHSTPHRRTCYSDIWESRRSKRRRSERATHSCLFRAHFRGTLPGPSTRLHMYHWHAPGSGVRAY